MSIETAVKAALSAAPAVSAIVGSKIFPMVATEGEVVPYIVYQVSASTREGAMNGPGSLRNARMQLDCYAATYSAAKALGAAVRAALDGAGLQSAMIIEQDLLDPETKSYRQLIEYSIWANEP